MNYNIELIERKVVDRGHFRWLLKVNGEGCEYIQFMNKKNKDFFHKYPMFVYDWKEDENSKLIDLEKQIVKFINNWELKQTLTPDTAKTFEDIIDGL